jgi:hypothetical protein
MYEQGMYKLTSLTSNKSYKISEETYDEAIELVKLIQKKPETKPLGNIESNFQEDIINQMHEDISNEYDLPF